MFTCEFRTTTTVHENLCPDPLVLLHIMLAPRFCPKQSALRTAVPRVPIFARSVVLRQSGSRGETHKMRSASFNDEESERQVQTTAFAST